MDIFNIKDKVIVLTGTTGHIGKELSSYLTSHGATVVGLSRNISETDNNFRVDLCNDSERKNLVKLLAKKFRKIDCLINNAYSGKPNKLENTTREDFENSLDINIISPILFVNELADIMSENSSIINIASMYGVVSPDPGIYGNTGKNNPIYYGAGKAALIQATKYLACHLTEKKIRSNSISPGPFPPFQESDLENPFFQKLMQKNPMNRLGKPEDLFGVVHFLASDASSYVNGANIPVDGGWTAW